MSSRGEGSVCVTIIRRVTADVCVTVNSQQAERRQALESVSVDLSNAIVLKVSADGGQEWRHLFTSTASFSSG